MVEKRLVDPIIPFPPGRFFVWRAPGNTLSGYDHFSPSGTKDFQRLSTKLTSRSLQTERRVFEDENDDEDEDEDD